MFNMRVRSASLGFTIGKDNCVFFNVKRKLE